MIAILNYGLGNLGSIANMLKVINEKAIITADPEEINKSDGIILPGVGAFDAGMSKLEEANLIEIIKNEAKEGKPILGICLGMQLLGRGSEEGVRKGLDLISFDCVRFRFDDSSLKIPHMGWDVVNIKKEHRLVSNLDGLQRYYFVHSYHVRCDSEDDILMTCDYGYEFACAVAKNNIAGVQFHPEKSHDYGMALLNNFVKICH